MNMKEWLDGRLAAEKRPAIPLLSFPCVRLLGISVRDLIADSALQARGMAEIARRCPAGAAVSMMDLSVEAECFGSEIRFSDDEVPTVTGAVVREPGDADALAVPGMGAGRTGVYVEAIAQARRLITDRPVFAGVIGPFSLAGRLMGMTEILFNCYDEPEAVHTVLEKAAEFLARYVRAYKEAGADGVMLAEPAAGLLSPGLCAEFSSPYVKRIVDAAQDDSFLLLYHNCGNAVDKMIPEILSTGCLGYHFGNASDLAALLGKMPDDRLVMGNVDPVTVFRQGTPAKAREAALSLLAACSKHRQFILSSGCDIPPATPWENIDAFFAAVEEFYGRG